MYYLFLHKPKDLIQYKMKLLNVLDSIEKGKTNVYDELKSAKIGLIECFPFQTISGIMPIIGSFAIAKISCNETIKIAVIMLINSFCYSIANFIFAVLKHNLRLKLLKRLKLIPTDRLIVAMESLEYQSI